MLSATKDWQPAFLIQFKACSLVGIRWAYDRLFLEIWVQLKGVGVRSKGFQAALGLVLFEGVLK